MKYINKRLPEWTAEESGENTYWVYKSKEFIYSCPSQVIIGSPDWQLKPSFEITAFRDSLSGQIARLENESYKYGSGVNWCLENMLSAVRSKNGIEIFSVIREDGIEFSLQQKTNLGTIKKFEIIEDEMIVFMEVSLCGSSLININQLTPAKKVLFVTEDGVTGYDDNSDWYVVNSSYVVNGNAEVRVKKPENIYYGVEKVFSTREAAETYISQNKPKYSENQIREALKYRFNSDVDYLLTKLNEKK